MVLLKVKELQYYYLTIPENKKRIENIEKNLNDIKLEKVYSITDKNISKFQSGAAGFCKMIDKALKDQGTSDFISFGLLEDDVVKYRDFPDTIEIPENTDILYIGTSICGYNNRTGLHRRYVFTEKVNDRKDIYIIKNMLATHGLIITSIVGANYVKAAMDLAYTKNVPYDTILAGLQIYYNVYCLKSPLVYQDGRVGGDEKGTRSELNLRLLNKRIPKKIIINL